ncbi:MAG: US12 family protein [Planctomycetales bacterium]|nr:US12 family protein [Planctomycetales bacterium]
MSFDQNPYQTPQVGWSPYAAMADVDTRTAFIRRTYTHLFGAVLAFIGIEALIFTMVPDDALANMVRAIGGSRFGWLVVLGGFMFVSYIANKWAMSSTSLSTQYMGLGIYVIAEALIFVPILYVASRLMNDPMIIPIAGLVTGIVFIGLTAMVFITRADFSWLGRFLWLAGMAAMAFIVLAIVFQGGHLLGLVFSTAMVALAAGYILYDTSNVLHRYRTDQHVAAALALFASVALLFWYVLRIVMSLSRD